MNEKPIEQDKHEQQARLIYSVIVAGKSANFADKATRAFLAAVEAFRRMLKDGKTPPFSLADMRVELHGKNLACWCKIGTPCHADVLLELANA